MPNRRRIGAIGFPQAVGQPWMWSTIGAITGRDASGQGHLVRDLLNGVKAKPGWMGPRWDRGREKSPD